MSIERFRVKLCEIPQNFCAIHDNSILYICVPGTKRLTKTTVTQKGYFRYYRSIAVPVISG